MTISADKLDALVDYIESWRKDNGIDGNGSVD